MSSINHLELLQKTIAVIETFEPKRQTVDGHADDSPIVQDKKLGEVERRFIRQVFYGCMRYQKFLKLFVTSFLYQATAASNEDKVLYMIYGYMLFFRLGELGIEEFKKFFTCGLGTPPALFALLKYVLSEEELNKWVKLEWCKLYDMAYIENEIIGGAQRNKPLLAQLFDEMEIKATGHSSAAEAKGETQRKVVQNTIPKPFNLTAPKPRLVPQPDEIARVIEAQPVPQTINKTNLEKIAQERQTKLDEERKRVSMKYPEDLHFHLEVANRCGDHEVEEIRKEVEAVRFQECTFKPKIGKPYHPPEQEADVHQNVASVLREDALVKNKQLKEYQNLMRFETELRDASEFFEWQHQKRVEDHNEEEARVQKRRVQMQMAREEAIAAQQHMVRKKHISVEHKKEESKAVLAQVEVEHAEVLEQKRKLVAEVLGDRGRARVAEDEIEKQRRSQALLLRKEKKLNAEKKKAEDAHEMERKKDIIRQIRALERVSVVRPNPFDPFEAPRGGYMEEMPLSELRERLNMVTAQRAKEIEDKKELNLAKKVTKQQQLQERVEVCAAIREHAKIEAKERHMRAQVKKQEEEEAKKRFSEQCNVEVAEKVAKKKKMMRDEEIRLAKELKEISVKRQFLAANAEMVEAKQKHEQQKGLQRVASLKQVNMLQHQRHTNKIEADQYSMRLANKAEEREALQNMQRHVNERLTKAKADDAALKEDIKAASFQASNHRRLEESKLFAEMGLSASKYSTHRGLSGLSVSQSAPSLPTLNPLNPEDVVA